MSSRQLNQTPEIYVFSRKNSRPQIPVQPWLGTSIPRLIHQTYAQAALPQTLADNVAALRASNPDWSYRLYVDADIESFIEEAYGIDILRYYQRINPTYGAARADVFRYLLIYKLGGVYLDIKSRFSCPIDDVLKGDEGFIVSQWSNKEGERYSGYGLHDDLADIQGGEVQQWHVIAAPGHPFLKAVLEEVFDNIDKYRHWRDGTGKLAVLRATGPIAYTRAITPILDRFPCKILRNERQLSLDYSVAAPGDHHKLFKRHYSYLRGSLIRPQGAAVPLTIAWRSARALKGRVNLLLHRS